MIRDSGFGFRTRPDTADDARPFGSPPGTQLAWLSLAMFLGMTLWFSATAANAQIVAEFHLSGADVAWLTKRARNIAMRPLRLARQGRRVGQPAPARSETPTAHAADESDTPGDHKEPRP